MTTTGLILGHGAKYLENNWEIRCSPIPLTDWPDVYISVEYDKAAKPTIIHDLRVTPWPVKCASFHTIIDTCGLGLHRMYIQKGVPRFLHEVQRVLAPNGVFYGRGGFKFVSGTVIEE